MRLPLFIANRYLLAKKSGMGGVRSARDVIEMMLAGATCVGIGAENLRNPYAARDVVAALPDEMAKYNIDNLSDIIGGAHHG